MGPGAYDEAIPYLEQALALAREIDDREGMAVALYNLGDVAFRQGESGAAERYAQESLAICREIGDRQGMAFALRVLGFATHLREEYEETARYHEASQDLYREIGDRWGVATGFINRGEAARMQGKYEEAARCYEASLPIFKEIGNRLGIAIGFLNLGHAHAGMGKDAAALKYLRESLKTSLAIGALSIALEGLAVVALLQAKADQLEQAVELLGLVLGHPTLTEEIKVNAAPTLAMLREALPADELEVALVRGRALDLETVVAGLLAEVG
jgi:tetratricopeptide (TPR) repeat protein